MQMQAQVLQNGACVILKSWLRCRRGNRNSAERKHFRFFFQRSLNALCTNFTLSSERIRYLSLDLMLFFSVRNDSNLNQSQILSFRSCWVKKNTENTASTLPVALISIYFLFLLVGYRLLRFQNTIITFSTSKESIYLPRVVCCEDVVSLPQRGEKISGLNRVIVIIYF